MSAPVHVAETCSTTVLVPCEVLLAYVSDPLNLPAWAPDFAADVSPSIDGTWLLRSAEGERHIVVRAFPDLGAVDFVSATDPQLGAFLRVLPSGTASLVTFSLLFPRDTARDVVESAMRGAVQELANLREILEP